MDYWVLKDEPSSIFLQPLIASEGVADLEWSHLAPDSSYIMSKPPQGSVHAVGIFLTVPHFYRRVFEHVLWSKRSSEWIWCMQLTAPGRTERQILMAWSWLCCFFLLGLHMYTKRASWNFWRYFENLCLVIILNTFDQIIRPRQAQDNVVVLSFITTNGQRLIKTFYPMTQ